VPAPSSIRPAVDPDWKRFMIAGFGQSRRDAMRRTPWLDWTIDLRIAPYHTEQFYQLASENGLVEVKEPAGLKRSPSPASAALDVENSTTPRLSATSG